MRQKRQEAPNLDNDMMIYYLLLLMIVADIF